MMLTGKERNKTRHSATLSTTNIIRTGLGVTQGLCGTRLASYRLGRGTCSLDVIRLCERNKSISSIFLAPYCPLVSGQTDRFVIQQSYFQPTQCLCFVRVWKQTAIISLYSINCMVCITETGRVYCVVRAGYLNTIQVNLGRQCSRYGGHKSSTIRNTSKQMAWRRD
jgi:hypothetical protein